MHKNILQYSQRDIGLVTREINPFGSIFVIELSRSQAFIIEFKVINVAFESNWDQNTTSYFLGAANFLKLLFCFPQRKGVQDKKTYDLPGILVP